MFAAAVSPGLGWGGAALSRGLCRRALTPIAPQQVAPGRQPLCRTWGSAAAVPTPPEEPAGSAAAAGEGGTKQPEQQQQSGGIVGWFKAQQAKGAEGRAKLAALGLAAVLAYGLFDGLTYTIAFIIAFLGYEAKTGLNPTQNVGDLVKICVLMWAGNNVTRPFRIAGAAALAPTLDKFMDSLQQRLKLPSKVWAFALVVAAVAGTCFSILGTLFLSRWIRG